MLRLSPGVSAPRPAGRPAPMGCVSFRSDPVLRSCASRVSALFRDHPLSALEPQERAPTPPQAVGLAKESETAHSLRFKIPRSLRWEDSIQLTGWPPEGSCNLPAAWGRHGMCVRAHPTRARVHACNPARVPACGAAAATRIRAQVFFGKEGWKSFEMQDSDQVQRCGRESGNRPFEIPQENEQAFPGPTALIIAGVFELVNINQHRVAPAGDGVFSSLGGKTTAGRPLLRVRRRRARPAPGAGAGILFR